MASQGYRDWLKVGRPYTLIRPARAVQTVIRRYGITVYDYPNDAHLTATVPEDHTPFSVTSWPLTNGRWRGHALDVMPRSGSAEHRAENADIARQLIADRDAGVPGVMWIKYLNWTDEAGRCEQVRWTDAANPLRHTVKPSTDRGHIHISGRSDCATDERADGYDPIARMRGSAPLAGDDDMSYNDRAKADAAFNNDATAPLDTDGTIDGKGNIQRFPNKTYVAIEELRAQVEKLRAIVVLMQQGGTPASGGVGEDRVREIAREELGTAEIVPGGAVGA